LLLVSENPDISVEGITEHLNKNFKTVSEHTRRLVQAGLINKNYRGKHVLHSLSPYGKKFIAFLKTFQHSWECLNVCIYLMISHLLVARSFV